MLNSPLTFVVPQVHNRYGGGEGRSVGGAHAEHQRRGARGRGRVPGDCQEQGGGDEHGHQAGGGHRGAGLHLPAQGLPGKCSTVTSRISICVSVLQFAATV